MNNPADRRPPPVETASGATANPAGGTASAASAAAQSGPLHLVTTDTSGNLGADGGAFFNGIAEQQAAIAWNRNDIDKNQSGVAMALALDSPFVPQGQKFAVSSGLGFFEGASAFALSGAARFNDNLLFNAGVGVGFQESTVGGRVGMT